MRSVFLNPTLRYQLKVCTYTPLFIGFEVDNAEHHTVLVRQTLGAVLDGVVPLVIGGGELVRFVQDGKVHALIDGCGADQTVRDKDGLVVGIVAGDDAAGVRKFGHHFYC